MLYPKFSFIFQSNANKKILCTAVRNLVDTQNVVNLSDQEIEHAVDLQIRDTEYEKTLIMTRSDTLTDYNLMAASRAVRDINEAKSKISAAHVRELIEKEEDVEKQVVKRTELQIKDRHIEIVKNHEEEPKKRKTPRNLLHSS